MRLLRRHLPGALLVVGAGVAIGVLLGLGAERMPAVPLHTAAPAEHGGEEPGHSVATAAGEPAIEPLAGPVPPSLDLAALPPALALAPGMTLAGGREDSTVLAATLKPPQPAGQPLWLRNAVPFALPAARPMIALVFDDLGMDRVHTARVIRLPGPLTLSFLPYAGELGHQTAAGRAAGHELLLHMPMEPLATGLDPGPGALLVRLPPDEILRRLDRALGAFSGYVGINNHMGSRFTSDRAAMTPVLAELKRRGLLFLDSVTAGSSVGAELAASLHLPHTHRAVFLDDELTPGAVHANLMRLEEVARRTGAAVAIGHPHEVTLEVVTPWLAGLAAKGFVLAPVSAIVRARGYGGSEGSTISVNDHRKG